MNEKVKYYGLGSDWGTIELDSSEEGFNAGRFQHILKSTTISNSYSLDLFPIDKREQKYYLEYNKIRCLKIEVNSYRGHRLKTEIQDSNNVIRQKEIGYEKSYYSLREVMIKLREFLIDFADNYQTWEAWDAEQTRLAKEKQLQEQNERYKKLEQENVALKQKIKELKDSLIEITGKLEQLAS